MPSEILATLFNTLTAADMHSCHNSRKLRFNFKRSYLQKYKHFLEILLHFQNLHKILSILKNKRSSELKYVLSYIFREMLLLECPKTVVSEHRLEMRVSRY